MLSTIPEALTQFNANAAWYSSLSAAALRLESIEFLLVNRPQRAGDQGSNLDFESLENQAKALRDFLGAGAPRAFGRRRMVAVAHKPIGGLQ